MSIGLDQRPAHKWHAHGTTPSGRVRIKRRRRPHRKAQCLAVVAEAGSESLDRRAFATSFGEDRASGRLATKQRPVNAFARQGIDEPTRVSYQQNTIAHLRLNVFGLAAACPNPKILPDDPI